MLVYRVENDKGHGPFWEVWNIVDKSVYEDIHECLKELFGSCNNHPIPRNDVIAHGVLGCRSMEMLAEWFNHDRLIKLLTANGFHISIYNVKTVMRDCKQVSFSKRNAKLVDTLPLSHLIGIL